MCFLYIQNIHFALTNHHSIIICLLTILINFLQEVLNFFSLWLRVLDGELVESHLARDVKL